MSTQYLSEIERGGRKCLTEEKTSAFVEKLELSDASLRTLLILRGEMLHKKPLPDNLLRFLEGNTMLSGNFARSMGLVNREIVMNADFGPMVGCETAITWVENLKGVDNNIKERVIRRMKYEFVKDIPVAPKFHKGKYGKKYDYMTCGQCGFGLSVINKYCPNCGYAVGNTPVEA